MQNSSPTLLAIGLMSGTSMDGIDLALIESDGKEFIRHLGHDYQAFSPEFKQRIRNLIDGKASLIEIKRLENEITRLHANLVNSFLAKRGISSSEIDLIGFHGQTILHAPTEKITWQLGNPQLLAHETKITVIGDFRMQDVINGGQGAPLVPIYHRALFSPLFEPQIMPNPTQETEFFKNQNLVASPEFNLSKTAMSSELLVLNIGGISNLTYFNRNPNSLCAFDVAFGNAPFDDLMQEKFGCDFDKNGELAATGEPDLKLIEKILQHEIFHQKPPKSYHRNDFQEPLKILKSISPANQLASLSLLFAKIIRLNLGLLDEFLSSNAIKADFSNKNSSSKTQILICGGGRKNLHLLKSLRFELPEIEIKSTDDVGISGDIIEAEAFAYLAILRVLRFPSSFKLTTSVNSDGNRGCVGGVIYQN